MTSQRVLGSWVGRGGTGREGELQRRSSREAWRCSACSLGSRGRVIWVPVGRWRHGSVNFRENRARGGGSGTASRLMVMAMGKWMLITRDLVSRGLGQWPEESPLQADGKGAHGRPGGESFSGKCTVSNVTFCREREKG